MASNTTKYTMECVEYILENRKYIKIGIEKYKQKFDASIETINKLLGFNILSESLAKIEERIEELKSIDYIWVTEDISVLREELSAIVLEEKDPMIPKFRTVEREFDEER